MFWEMAQGFETSEWPTPPEQSMYTSPQWLQEPFTFSSSPATTNGVPWSDGENSHGILNKLSCSSNGSAWSKSLVHFGDGQKVL